MRVQVRLYAQLASYLPSGATGNRAELVLPEGMTVAELVGRLALPEQVARSVIFLLDGEHVGSTRRLAEGDVLSILPPIVGGSIELAVLGS